MIKVTIFYLTGKTTDVNRINDFLSSGVRIHHVVQSSVSVLRQDTNVVTVLTIFYEETEK